MVAAAWEGAKEADIDVVLVDASRGLDADTRRILDGLNQAWIIVSKPTALPAIASGQGKFRLWCDRGWVGIITAS